MHQTSNFKSLLQKPNSLFFHHTPNFFTKIPPYTTHLYIHTHTNLHTNNNHAYIYDHLLFLCLQQCKKIQSRRLFDEMPERLSRASKLSRIIHSHSLKNGFGFNGKLGNSIVDLYAKCGKFDFAEKAFFCLELRDVTAWNSILSMYSRGGFLERVINYFSLMLHENVAPNQFTFAVILSSCARLGNAEFGKRVHGNIIKLGLDFNSFCVGSLIDFYCKMGNVGDARKIFDSSDKPDTVSWTAMIAGYVNIGLPEESMKLFKIMQEIGHIPDRIAFVTVISACMGLGKVNDACYLFSKMPNPNDVAWNVMISGYTKAGHEREAIIFYRDMMKSGVKSTRSTFGSVLSAVASLSNVKYGLQVHAQAMKQGLDSNVYVGSSLINMYSKCQKMEDARLVFDILGEKNVVLWNAILGGYTQNGNAYEVVELFFKMKFAGFCPDDFTFTSILSACGSLENMGLGSQLHSFIIKKKLEANLFVGNALVDMYAKCGALDLARRKFEKMKSRDNVSWNAIIVGYVQEEDEDEAFKLFRRMKLDGISPDEVSLASILSAFANIRDICRGKQIHCISIKCGLENSLFSGSSLIDMYAKCGDVTSAYKVFISMPERSVVSSNALIAGFVQESLEKAVNIFHFMLCEGLRPTEVTFACLLDSCIAPQTINFGKQIHCFILKAGVTNNDDFLGVSLLAMYMNSQEKTEAKILFSEFRSPKSTILWTAIISGHAQHEFNFEALNFYQEMRRNNSMPDQATFVSVLKVCANLASLRDGREIHSLIFHTGYNFDELTGSALIDMYAKCGNIENSFQVFKEMGNKNDVISWNSMISGFAKNGYAENALEIFNDMTRSSVTPDDVTFLAVLTACSHTGRVSEGREIFHIMNNKYKIKPRVDHCACMIDLLGRWGFLDEAQDFIEKLEFEPDAKILASFLGVCRLHGDDIRGQKAAEKLIELDPKNSSPYILLSNIYASSGNWSGVNYMRRKMKEKGVTKLPGCSWIVVGQKTNLFVAGDELHSNSDEIHKILIDLMAPMKDEDDVSKIENYLHVLE